MRFIDAIQDYAPQEDYVLTLPRGDMVKFRPIRSGSELMRIRQQILHVGALADKGAPLGPKDDAPVLVREIADLVAFIADACCGVRVRPTPENPQPEWEDPPTLAQWGRIAEENGWMILAIVEKLNQHYAVAVSEGEVARIESEKKDSATTSSIETS